MHFPSFSMHSSAKPWPSFSLAIAWLFLPPFLLLLLSSDGARARHVITIPSTPPAGLSPSGLAWDPTAQHFLVGSRLPPTTVISVSDAGIADTIVSEEEETSPVASVAIDDARRRLVVALARPAALAVYDLRSPRPHRRIFLTRLPVDPSTSPGGVAVEPASGAAFVSAGNVVVKVDLQGDASIFSRWRFESRDLGGIAWVSGRDFFLAVERETGRLLKLSEDRAAQEVLLKGPAPIGDITAVAVRNDGGAVVAGEGAARWLKSNDGWGESVVYDQVVVGDTKLVEGATVRDRQKAYILVIPTALEEEDKQKERSTIEELEWEKESEGEMVWGMVWIGIALAVLFFWRFQMRQLASNMNKKRA